MNRIAEFPDQSRIEEEAAAWIARLDGGSLTADELRVLRRWSRTSKRHRQALEEYASIWDVLDVLAVAQQPAQETSIEGYRWIRVGGALAAGLAVLALAFGLLRMQGSNAPNPEQESIRTYITAIGQQRTMTLPDDSMVQLNTNSRLQVQYSGDRRDILLQQGEAFFDVTEDERPFVVNAGLGQVAAVGTEFAVRLWADNVVEFDVTEGTVRVTANVEPGTSLATGQVQSRIFSAGDQGRIDQTIELVDTVDPAFLKRQLSWRSGVLFFDGDSLESVIAEVSRYTPVEIVIADPSLRSLKVAGYFQTGDTEVLLDTLASSFDIEADYVRPGLIYLHPR